MKILMHDYGGYPFPVDLSRELAERGHEVQHTYCGSLKTTPGRGFKRTNEDAAGLTFSAVTLSEPLEKYSLIKRWRQERRYGQLIADQVDIYSPDVVVSANTPLDAQRPLQNACRQKKIPFVFWLQDILSLATQKLLSKRIPGIGHMIGEYYKSMEANLLKNSDWNILITSDFEPVLQRWGIQRQKTSVIENWAPIREIPVKQKINQWSSLNGLSDKKCIVYTGTMGLKHNPALMLKLALKLKESPDCRVVVISEGKGADWLRRKALELELDNLLVHPFTPFEDIPDVMATAEVLVAILEPDAGVYSVPSKVLAYLCAERPLLLSVPLDNLAARTVSRAKAGSVHAPDDEDAFVNSAIELLNNESKRRQLGCNARSYAQTKFNIKEITDQFLVGFRKLTNSSAH
ncbi:glycosyltransferase family 4 protein [Rhodopirellula halodulae]|uniref:glycosyltransferase family 4 protein n=1 Tax=Rhodopirellula halodulae TaxID=2894198 RepID=UPI001E283BB7|nr:glycosyltransferase family 4 protein [Rhodopirellula sp. JC737]MCC9654436.1 glycosyltransferase family 4 protein [Rhodopirellula sp. JC737]